MQYKRHGIFIQLNDAEKCEFKKLIIFIKQSERKVF